MLVENFYVCKSDFNDSFTVLTIIVRKQYILQHQSSQSSNVIFFNVSYPDGMVGILSFLQDIALEIHTMAQNMQPF